jgi:predicted kinase
MTTVTLLVGLPGSGKSSSIPEDFDGFIYSTDNFIESVAKMNHSTYNAMFQDLIGQATSRMDEQLQLAIKQQSNVILDQTNMSTKKRRSMLSRFPSDYRKICICRVLPRDDLEWKELNRRILSRPGKMIPSHVIKSMTDSFVQPSLNEGFDEIYLFDIYGNELV